MKTRILILSLGLFAAAAFADNAPAKPAAPEMPVDVYNALKKERDDLKAQNAALAAQLQQTSDRMVYFQKLSEVNQLAVKLVGDELQAATARAAQLQTELTAEQAKAAAPPAKK